MSVRHCNRYNNIARPWKLVPPHFSLRVSEELSGIMETGKPCLSTASTPALSTIIFSKCLCFSYFILDRTTSLHAGHCRPALPLLYCKPPALYLYERLEDLLAAHLFLQLHSISMGVIYYHSLICRSLILNMISKRRSRENVFADKSSLADVWSLKCTPLQSH